MACVFSAMHNAAQVIANAHSLYPGSSFHLVTSVVCGVTPWLSLWLECALVTQCMQNNHLHSLYKRSSFPKTPCRFISDDEVFTVLCVTITSAYHKLNACSIWRFNAEDNWTLFNWPALAVPWNYYPDPLERNLRPDQLRLLPAC